MPPDVEGITPRDQYEPGAELSVLKESSSAKTAEGKKEWRTNFTCASALFINAFFCASTGKCSLAESTIACNEIAPACCAHNCLVLQSAIQHTTHLTILPIKTVIHILFDQ
jgi:hypothetical protein